MITTIDNPFNPFTNFKEWFAFDTQMGYNTASYLARIAKTSEELSENDNLIANEEAIDSIVKLNVLGIYRKVYREDYSGPVVDIEQKTK